LPILLLSLLPAPASAINSGIHIVDDATGGECTTVGNWDLPTKTCTLTQDVFEEIVIWANDVTLDCDGHSVTGPGWGIGVDLPAVMGVTVKNCRVTSFDNGFWLASSDWNTLYRNTAYSNNGFGFFLSNGSYGNTLDRNAAYDNNDDGFALYESDSNRLRRNRAFGNVWGFGMYFSGGNGLFWNRGDRNDIGFYLDDSDGNLLYENAGHRNNEGDAYQESNCMGNRWMRNRFGSTYGIP